MRKPDDETAGQVPAGGLGDAVTFAIVTEAASVAVSLALLWYLGPGKVRIDHLLWRIRTMCGARAEREDAEVASLRREISAWEHRP